jgi:hypothetical protein
MFYKKALHGKVTSKKYWVSLLSCISAHIKTCVYLLAQYVGMIHNNIQTYVSIACSFAHITPSDLLALTIVYYALFIKN